MDLQALFNPFSQGSPLSALVGDNGLLSNPTGAWDEFKNGRTNEVNKEIASENLGYQRERNAIEDARYEEETAYNRAFAEEERDYQRRFAEEQRDYSRALQQQLFEREDTALERQAESLSKMGINPLSQQLNGLGAGQAVSATSPVGSNSPSSSAHGGSPLHNDFQMQDVGVLQGLAPLLSLADTLNGVQTGSYQRDALALQNDAQYLENLHKAHTLGIKYRGYLPFQAGTKNYRNSLFEHRDKNGVEINDKYFTSLGSQFQKDVLSSNPDWVNNLYALGEDKVYEMAEKALTKGSSLFDKSFENLFDKENGQSLYDLGKGKNGKFNPFNLLLNLFF